MTGFEALQQLRLPDAWQAEAIRGLAAGDDVIVQAPTGAGKTFIFEQYFQQRRGPGQIIYTVPTRALANDKFAEWNRRGWRVGITTGDLAHDTAAPLVVATLEAQQQPENAALYVIDEYQWLADPLRGNHYEGTILSLPAQTQLLLLSGSVANPGVVRDWLRRLERGRNVTMIEQRERPVPLDEMEIDSLARNVPDSITGYWTRRIAGALRDDLGPILVFAPHRKEAEKIAKDVAARIPCPQPLRLTKDQENAAGPDLAKLLGQRVAFHHSGLGYVQRAGLIEPLAKGGQLRVVVATLGLSAGINFSLRSVLVTATSFTAGGFPREVTPSDLLQMFGRAGRRGLDEQGYVLVSERSPRFGQARAGHLRRSAPLPWRPLLQELAHGGPIANAVRRVPEKAFHHRFHSARHRVDAKNSRAAAVRPQNRCGPGAAGAARERPCAVLPAVQTSRRMPRARPETGAALALESRRDSRQAASAHAARTDHGLLFRRGGTRRPGRARG